MVGKACPVVLRRRAGQTEVLVFQHPLAGMQLVKGSIERGETPERAAQRELLEEAGIYCIPAGRSLGSDVTIAERQVWHFVLCPVSGLPDRWTFRTEDDGGHLFAFSWHGLDEPMNEGLWHPTFIRAVSAIRELLKAPSPGH